MLNQYIEKIDVSGSAKFKCTLCGKLNGQKAHTENHIESIHFPGTFVYNCKYCGLRVAGRNKLYMHVNQSHKMN
jgi:DNA-directed RNA polymerase subunit RPC12/RpoP